MQDCRLSHNGHRTVDHCCQQRSTSLWRLWSHSRLHSSITIPQEVHPVWLLDVLLLCRASFLLHSTTSRFPFFFFCEERKPLSSSTTVTYDHIPRVLFERKSSIERTMVFVFGWLKTGSIMGFYRDIGMPSQLTRNSCISIRPICPTERSSAREVWLDTLSASIQRPIGAWEHDHILVKRFVNLKCLFNSCTQRHWFFFSCLCGIAGWHAIFRRNIVFCGWNPAESMFASFGKDTAKTAGMMGGMIFSGIFHEYRTCWLIFQV
jgi:hypothetical protein